MADTSTLVCPFLNHDPVYAFGVEFGMLWARMRGDEDEFTDCYTTDNQDQILLGALRAGWTAHDIEPWDEGWLKVRLVKNQAPVG